MNLKIRYEWDRKENEQAPLSHTQQKCTNFFEVFEFIASLSSPVSCWLTDSLVSTTIGWQIIKQEWKDCQGKDKSKQTAFAMFFRNTLIFSLSIYLAAHILPFRIALSINPPSQCIEKSNLISSKQTVKTRKQTQKCVQNESENLMKKEWQKVIF